MKYDPANMSRARILELATRSATFARAAAVLSPEADLRAVRAAATRAAQNGSAFGREMIDFLDACGL